MLRIILIIFICIKTLLSQNIKLHIIQSENLGNNDTVLVVTPEKKGSEPPALVFLLHGYSGNYNQWNKTLSLQTLANKFNCLIVCPDGLYDSWYLNHPKGDYSYEKFFFEELIPFIDSIYSYDQRYRFISGLSMGGFGAVSLIINHPDYFLAGGSTSGVLDLTPFKGNWGLDKIFSSVEEADSLYSYYSPINQLNKLSGKTNQLIVDCGTEDFAYNVNKAFYEKSRVLNVPVTFISTPGNHNHSYWKRSLPLHFEFFNQIRNGNYYR